MMVSPTTGNRLCPVELLGEDEADQLVREDQAREGDDAVGPSVQALVDAIGAADDKCQRLASRKYLLAEPRQGRGVERLAGFVQQDHVVGILDAPEHALRLFLARSRAIEGAMRQQDPFCIPGLLEALLVALEAFGYPRLVLAANGNDTNHGMRY